MEIVNLIQGTPAWHAHRAQHWNASDAPAMMGCSPYMTRTELLQRLHTGLSQEVDAATQRRFDEGHRFEALARPLAEAIIGEELFPVTGVEGRYSASFDGLTMLEDVALEHKTLSASLSDVLHADCKGFELPMHYQVQMEHQAMVSGCERILFMASKWNGDTLVEERHCWYMPNPELRAKIVAGWAQLDADLAAYVPNVATVTPVAKVVASLPVVFDMRVEGKLISCNLEQYKPAALAYIESINTALETEQDFGDAEADAKFCRESASKLKLAIEQALGQMGDINTALTTVRDIASAFDAKGLALEKLVKARKEELRQEIVLEASRAYNAHIEKLTARIGWVPVRSTLPDFAGAIKGKRILDSIRDAVNTELAQAKIAASELADRIEANIKTLKGEANDWSFLFPDLDNVANKPADDFSNLLASRVAMHKAAEEKRLEAERERIRAEEAARLEREQREAQERARLEAEATAKAAQVLQQAAAPVAAQPAPAVTEVAPIVSTAANVVPITRPVADTGARLKLGQINERLAPISLSVDGLAQLGFQPVAIEKAARLYRESDFPLICNALIKHLSSIGQRAAA